MTTRTVHDADNVERVLRNHRGSAVMVAGADTAADRSALRWRAACSCGWQGLSVVIPYWAVASCTVPAWEQLPGPHAEWTSHTAPLLWALAQGIAETDPRVADYGRGYDEGCTDLGLWCMQPDMGNDIPPERCANADAFSPTYRAGWHAGWDERWDAAHLEPTEEDLS